MQLESFLQDLTYGLRSLRRDLGFALIVVVTLAFGIAGNTVVFSLLNPYFVRALPFGEPERLVQLGQLSAIHEYETRFSSPQLADYRERSEAFEDLAGYYYGNVNLTGDEGAERYMAGWLTANMFSTLQASPLHGRTFVGGEDGPGAPAIAVLGHGIWQSRFAGDPEIVGRSIDLDGVPHTVVGIMPPRFNFPFGGVKLWLPMAYDPGADPRGVEGTLIVGRLKDDWTLDRAREELTLIQRGLGTAYPEIDGEYVGVNVTPLREALNFAWDVLRVGFTALLAGVAIVLLIACVNVASLVVARSTARARELAVRTAIGASRGRLVRQMLTENLILAVAGGALGVILAVLVTRAVGPAVPEDLYRIGEVTIDRAVLGFTLAVTLLTPLLFGLAPALSATRSDPAQAIREGSLGAGVGPRSMRMRRGLVLVEITLAVVLVSAAGLMVRSMMAVQRADLGFDPDVLLTVEVSPPESDYATADEVHAYYDRAAQELAALPGVRSVGHVRPLPLNHENYQTQFARPGREPATAESWPIGLHGFASPTYFEAMGVPVLEGRAFTELDGTDATSNVIVSRSLAERLWENESAIGQSLLYGDPNNPSTSTVVGVVADLRHFDIDGPFRPHIYRPLAQGTNRRRFLVLRTADRPAELALSARRTLAGVDPNLPTTIRKMNEIVTENTFQWTLSSAFLGTFGLGGVLLAALGIFGVMSYSVARRRRELAIRAAVGATTPTIRRLILGEGLKLAAIGIVVGLALSIAVGRLMASLLYGIGPFDLTTFVVAAALFVAVTVLASARPARLAGRTDIMTVLRYD